MKKPLSQAWGRSGSGKLGLAGLGGVMLLGLLGGCAANAAPSRAPDSAKSSAPQAQEVDALTRQGLELVAAHDLQGAASKLQLALEKCRTLDPPRPKTLAHLMGELSNALVQLKNQTGARALLAEAMTLVTPGSLEDDKRIYQLQMVWAESYRYEKQKEQAVAHFEQAAAAAARHDTELAGQQVEALDRLATTLTSLNREADANQALVRAYAVAMRTPALRGRALSLIGPALFKREGLEALGQRGGFARRRLRNISNPVDISLEEGLSFEPAASMAPAPGVSDSSTSPNEPTPALESSGTVSNAAHVVAAMRKDFRTCYQRALTEMPNAQGSVRLLLKVGGGGEVLVVQALALGLPKSSVDCLLERALAGQFDPPEGGSAVIAVPVTFVKQ